MGFLYPHISYYIYLPLCVVIMIVFIATAEWFTYVCRYLNSTETKFSFKVVNFISMTWHLLMISSLSLFFWYIYPELLLLNTVFCIVVICQCVVAAVNTLYLCLKDYDPIKNRIYFVYTSVLSLFYLWTSFMVIWPLSVLYVFTDMNVYVILSNEWIVMVALNFITKNNYFQDHCVIIIETITVCFSMLRVLKPNDFFESLSPISCIQLYAFHLFCIIILYLQSKYGSRFFLPKKCRRKVYEEYLHSVYDSSTYINILQCQLCTNLIIEPELEYSEIDTEYKWIRLSKGSYIKTTCGHTFHLNCLLMKLKYAKRCPYCQNYLNIDYYDD